MASDSDRHRETASSIVTNLANVAIAGDPSVPAPGPPRPNFPVAPEVRRMIYAYFIEGKLVKNVPTDGTVASYQFDKTIFLVNKEIYKEAKDCMLGINNFVTVGWNWPEFGHCLTDYSVPVIQQYRNPPPIDEVLRVRVVWPTERLGRSHNPTMRYALMLAEDVAPLVKLLKVINFRTDSHTPRILTARGEKPLRWIVQTDMSRIEFVIEFRETDFCKPGYDFQRTVLETFGKAYGLAQRVEILGDVDGVLVNQAKHSMMPPVVWGYAVGWDIVKELGCMNQDALVALKDGNKKRALGCLWRAMLWADCCPILPDQRPDGRLCPTTLDGANDWEMGRFHLMYDCCMMLAQLALADGKPDLAGKVATSAATLAEKRLRHDNWPASLYTDALYLRAICLSEKGLNEEARHEFDVISRHDPPATVGRIAPIEDSTKLEAFLHQPGAPQLTWANSYWFTHNPEPVIINTFGGFQGSPPDGVEGWVDTSVRLTSLQKQKLRLPETYGLPSADPDHDNKGDGANRVRIFDLMALSRERAEEFLALYPELSPL